MREALRRRDRRVEDLAGPGYPRPRRPGAARKALSGALALVVLAVILLASGTLAAVFQPTSAAWTNSAVFAATASSGTWTSADGCVWVDAVTNRPVTPAPPCTVTVTITPWYGAGIQYSDPTTGRAARVMVTFAPQATGTQVPILTLHLNQGIIPSNWSWSTSRLASTQVTPTGSCTSLPSVTGMKAFAWYSSAEFVLWEKGSGSSTVCTGS